MEKALDYYKRSLTIYKELNHKRGVSRTMTNMGNLYNDRGDYNKSLKLSSEALDLAQEVGSISEINGAAESLSRGYKAIGNYEKAMKMYELFIETRDSVQSEKNQKEVMRQEFKYNYEKQAAVDSVASAKKRKIQEAQIAQQQAELKAKRNQQYALYGGLVLVLVFTVFIYNRFRITRAQKTVIEEKEIETSRQKNIIQEKHKDITDSIAYAKRIQGAILPSTKLLQEYLPESFVLYKPKDVVAGDFYWMEKTEDKILFAAADCTGHGVPGAMVSVVCSNGLNRSVREYKLTEPGRILDKTREIVIEEFEKSEEEVKDGMDIALCSLKGYTLQYAGAHNPLWIIRDGDVIEIKADKQPIGKFDKQYPYTTHTVELKRDDTIYIFSDGFADQFGGDKGKKFKSANFKKLLLSMNNESMQRQKELIEKAFQDWKGKQEQLDDVCVMGVRL